MSWKFLSNRIGYTGGHRCLQIIENRKVEELMEAKENINPRETLHLNSIEL